MDQSKRSSFIEAVINTAIGFLVTLILSPIVYPLFGHSFTVSQNLAITAIFTFTSIFRGYVVRRWFNSRIKQVATTISNYKGNNYESSL